MGDAPLWLEVMTGVVSPEVAAMDVVTVSDAEDGQCRKVPVTVMFNS